MTRTACQSAALEGVIMIWAGMIAEVFGIIIGLIRANARNAHNTLDDLGAHFLTRKALFASPLSPEALNGFMPLDQTVFFTVIVAVPARLAACRRTHLADAERKVIRSERG